MHAEGIQGLGSTLFVHYTHGCADLANQKTVHAELPRVRVSGMLGGVSTTS
jgi:hypothetical protein